MGPVKPSFLVKRVVEISLGKKATGHRTSFADGCVLIVCVKDPK
jgi:hypothetical protein